MLGTPPAILKILTYPVPTAQMLGSLCPPFVHSMSITHTATKEEDSAKERPDKQRESLQSSVI